MSVTVIVAEREPVAPGVNLTLIVQLSLAPRVAGKVPQLFVWLKSEALVPLNAMLLIVAEAVPVFFSVKLCAEEDVLMF